MSGRGLCKYGIILEAQQDGIYKLRPSQHNCLGSNLIKKKSRQIGKF